MNATDRQSTFSGTKEVAERLRFDVGRLEAYLREHVKGVLDNERTGTSRLLRRLSEGLELPGEPLDYHWVLVLRGCGILAPLGDVHAIATAMVTLLRNPDLAAQLGRRGYERLHRRYTFQRRVAEYRDLINELIEATQLGLNRPGAAPATGQRSGAERLLPG